MTRRVAAVLATIATITSAWPALDEKLQSYPSIHARETAKIKAGDAKGARYILVNAFHGLGNREQALLSSFALALATDSALPFLSPCIRSGMRVIETRPFYWALLITFMAA